MSPVAESAVNSPENPIVQIDRQLFARIEEQQRAVTLTERELTDAANEHKEAKKRHESALATQTALIAAMVRKVNGISDDAPLPLFDNQTDAINAAESDPVVMKLVARMLDHQVTHVNALIVAGYDEDQRGELSAYLDALDLRAKAEVARVNAEADGQVELPDVPDAPEVPAFLVPQEVSDEEVVGALHAVNVAMKKKHIRLMSQAQRRMVLEYSAKVQEVTLRLGEALTFEDLPAAPSFVIKPKELEAEQPEPETAAAKTPAPKKQARAPRRSSRQFKNTPRIAGKVSKAKGRKRQAVN